MILKKVFVALVAVALLGTMMSGCRVRAEVDDRAAVPPIFAL